jgi:uncharacterized protein YjbI with pentapeptide repeats
MHSRDPAKSDPLFQSEFQLILQTAAQQNAAADFTCFVFPSAHYPRHVFPAACIFSRAVFTGEANFASVQFQQTVDFAESSFQANASFLRAQFLRPTSFHTAHFYGKANLLADFKHTVTFVQAIFDQEADFYSVTFDDDVLFGSTEFHNKVVFARANFHRKAGFDGAAFHQEAFFAFATFHKNADFSGATFTQTVHFNSTTFTQQVDFQEARFLGSAEFRATNFRNDDSLFPGPTFSRAEFARPEAIDFFGTYFGHALFHYCDVTRLRFSSVEWRRRRGSGKRMLFDELVAPNLEGYSAFYLLPPDNSSDERNYGLVAEIYQQLKKNYDDRKDYWTGGDFHYGEMEMQRLHSARHHPLARWFHRNLGLVAWYRYASSYGESYARPALWLAAILLLFTLAFPLPGLTGSTPAPASNASTQPITPVASAATPTDLSYRNFAAFTSAYPEGKLAGNAAFFGNSLMTALSVAGFQKELTYQPSYPWGRALALLELLLTSTVIALFLLAIRRKFQR